MSSGCPKVNDSDHMNAIKIIQSKRRLTLGFYKNSDIKVTDNKDVLRDDTVFHLTDRHKV